MYDVVSKTESKVARVKHHKTLTAHGTAEFGRFLSGNGPSSEIFRKSSCVCGGGCPACEAKSRDLRISQPNDPAEIEADQLAETVMRMPANDSAIDSSESRKNPIGQTAPVKDSNRAAVMRKKVPGISSPLPRTPKSGNAQVDAVTSTGGRPLDRQTRDFFELRFGTDLSEIRIHTNSAAADSAVALDSRAYSIGRDIVFGPGEFQPHTQGGKLLLAHELAHIVRNHSNDEKAIHRWAVLHYRIPSWDEVREAGYSYMIDGLRSIQSAGIERLRTWASTLTPAQRTVANLIIDAVEGISGLLIQLILAVVGLVVGFVSGIVQMIVGLFELAVGIVRGILLFLYGFIDGGAAFDEWAYGVLEAISNIPAGLEVLITSWLTAFEQASTDRQVTMIAELAGQIVALIATFEVAAARAGSIPRISATLPRVSLPVLELAPEVSGGGMIGAGVRGGSRVIGGTAISVDAASPAIAGAYTGTVLMSVNSSISDLYGEGPETDAIQEADRRRAGMASRPQHHIFPREFRQFFEQRGFNDIDDFCVELEEASHQALHGGGDWRLGRTWPNEWNQRIMRQLTEAESYMGRAATREEILQIGRELMVEYGIEPDFVRWRGAR